MKSVSLSDTAKTGADSGGVLHRRAVGHLGFARVVARRCLLVFGPVVEMDDLAQDAALALVRAAAKYRAGMRADFATYAHRACWRGCLAVVRAALRRREALPTEWQGGAEAVAAAVAADTSPFEGMMGLELWALGGRVLSDAERQVVHARFRRGLTLREIGRERGVTPGRVRQIEVKAMAKLSRAAAMGNPA